MCRVLPIGVIRPWYFRGIDRRDRHRVKGSVCAVPQMQQLAWRVPGVTLTCSTITRLIITTQEIFCLGVIIPGSISEIVIKWSQNYAMFQLCRIALLRNGHQSTNVSDAYLIHLASRKMATKGTWK